MRNLKKLTRDELWDFGVKEGLIDNYAQQVERKIGHYHTKSTILEMISVKYKNLRA